MVGADSHMAAAGRGKTVLDAAAERARLAERFVRRAIGGRKATARQDREEHWDVQAPWGERLDVKSVPPGARYVNGGVRRPEHRTPVVEVSESGACRSLGYAIPDDYVHGNPPGASQSCWFVLTSSLRRGELEPTPIGSPLGPARPCPSCGELHPVGTTCADGWAPFAVPLPWDID